VQSEFVFIHDSTLEALVCGETQIPVIDFYSMWTKLNRTDKESGRTGLEKQFQVLVVAKNSQTVFFFFNISLVVQLLVKTTPNPSEVDRKAALQWPSCNRCTKYLPSKLNIHFSSIDYCWVFSPPKFSGDQGRVIINADDCDYIHASFINVSLCGPDRKCHMMNVNDLQH